MQGCCCYLCRLIQSNIRSRPTKFIVDIEITPVVSLSFEHHAGDSTILLGSTQILRENNLEVVRGLQLSSRSTTSREDLLLDGYLECPHATKALYIYKHPCLLWDSNPDPTAQQSVMQI
ncbi:uncharacterized protein TNCV_2704681 [Trichonephila clavipes]|nr:uncharacterized protein TNCV_2704681 [Trichonephila clavipes]